MDFEHWETFITLADCKSFTRTAELMNVSQTTVTNRIKQLENQIGKILFVRDTRSVQLSEAGSVLYPFARKGIETLKQGEFLAKSFVDFDEKIEVGGLISLWHYYLYPFIQEFRETYPNYLLRLHTGPTKRVFQLLFDGIVDVCIVPSRPQHPDMESLTLFEESFVLVGSPAMADVKEMTANELQQQSFIHIPWETPFIEWFHNEIGSTLLPIIEVDDTTLFTRILLDHNMIGFLPESVAKPYIEKNELIIIPFKSSYPIPKRTIHCIHHKKNSNSRAVQAFKNLLLRKAEAP